MRRAAYALPGLEQEGAHRYVSTGTFAYHEWALEPDADIHDLELVKQANPASWTTLAELRDRHDFPTMQEWQWRRFTCGQWAQGEFGAISDREWRACARPGLEIPDGARDVFVGVDLGWKRDCTAIVPVYRPDGQEVAQVGKPTIIEPPGDGTSLPVDVIFQACARMAARWPQLTS